MFDLKRLSKEAVPEALEKAERYRLLNEPSEAESICLDVLEVEPDNQRALVILLLALTDEIHAGTLGSVEQARAVVPRLRDEYDRHYYSGIICERRGKALMRQEAPGARAISYDWFREAMRWFEKAEASRPPGNDDALLRWNTCARILMGNPDLGPVTQEEGYEPVLE